MSKKIVLLGGGYGGILTAKKLARKFKKNEDVEITLIDKNPYHTMLTELHEVAANRVDETSIKLEFEKIFAHKKVNFVLDKVEKVDFENNVIKSDTNDYKYDYLVVGTGCKPTYWGVKGAEENSFPLWSYDDATRIKEHILNMFRQAIKEQDKKKRKKMLTFMVVGGGFTGIEMIGELGEWKKRLCKDFDISEDEVTLYVNDGAPKILPILPDKLIAKAVKRLNRLGVTVITNAPINEVGKDFVVLKDGRNIEMNTIIWAAGVESSELLEKTDTEKNGRNRIVTNEFLQSKEHKNVYVVGDNIFFIPKGEKRPVPQMVENAESSSALVAHNIICDIIGGNKKEYNPVFHGSMVCIGGRYGVAHLGTKPEKFFGMSGFFAMVVKHLINLMYFFQVAGFNKCWSYLMHEFFHIKDRRSITGGHFSKSSPNFWLVPLRMFVGIKWVLEGIAKLPHIIENPNDIFLIPASPLADAGSGASVAAEGAEGAVEAVQALPVPEFIKNIVDWSMGLMFYNPDGSYTGLASVFQIIMVIGEIAFGLMLIAGLFTFIASIGTMAMGMMIWSSSMAPPEMIWYIVAAVALIGGSGSVFGLDYYVLPWLNKKWKKLKFVRRLYIYID